ncbi:hypothetical protein ENC22_18980 [Hahella sp. KA22]|nr:hypothetical protein ENC22_18980 [Hahella sp. KA22]
MLIIRRMDAPARRQAAGDRACHVQALSLQTNRRKLIVCLINRTEARHQVTSPCRGIIPSDTLNHTFGHTN